MGVALTTRPLARPLSWGGGMCRRPHVVNQEKGQHPIAFEGNRHEGYAPLYNAMTAAELITRLDSVRRTSNGWQARCPAHEDRNPSLAIGEGDDGRILLHCHAGCDVEEVVRAIGLEMRDLHPGNAFYTKGSFRVERKPSFLNVEEGEGSGADFLSPRPDLYVEKENGGIRIRPLDVALAAARSEPDWLWPGYVAPGAITLIAGKPKAGKSTFMFGLLAALTRGEPFLGRPTARSGALLISEERHDTLAEKQRRFGLDGGLVDLIMRHEAVGHPWPGLVAAAVKHCHERNLRLLLIDTWDKFADLSGDAENSAGSTNAALSPLMVAAGGAGLAVVIFSHQRKSSGSHGEAVRGSNALIGGVDIIVELERVGRDHPDARVLRSESRYSGTPDELVGRLTDNNGYEAADDVGALRDQAGRGRILEVLRDGELTTQELAAALDQHLSTVNKYAGELLRAGAVVRRGAGKKGDPHRWSLPFASAAEVESQAAALGLPFDDEEAA
jgi:AAA domain